MAIKWKCKICGCVSSPPDEPECGHKKWNTLSTNDPRFYDPPQKEEKVVVAEVTEVEVDEVAVDEVIEYVISINNEDPDK